MSNNILEENRKIMSAISQKYKLRSKIADKAIDLGINIASATKSDNNIHSMADHISQANLSNFQGNTVKEKIDSCISQYTDYMGKDGAVKFCSSLAQGIKQADKLSQYDKSDNNNNNNGLRPNLDYYKGEDGQPDINVCIAEQEKNNLSHNDAVTYCGLLFKGQDPDKLMNSMKSASLDKMPKWAVASDFNGAKTKYLNMLEGNESKIKSAKLQQEDKKAYLMINEIYKTGGYYEENYSDNKNNNVKSASKRDPTAFIIINDYLHNKREYQIKAEENQQQQLTKSASKKSSNKLAYLRIKQFKETGEID